MTTPAFPAQVLIIRHGEKLGDPNSDADGGPNLSVWGSARAAALPSLFAQQQPGLSCAPNGTSGTNAYTATYATVSAAGEAPRFSPPDFVYATQASTSSNRPVETITPVLASLGMTCDDKHPDNDYGKVAEDIFAKQGGRNVLVCWHHGNIPGLADKLGIADAPEWVSTVFDRVWQITYDAAGNATLVDLPQTLLYGDSSS